MMFPFQEHFVYSDIENKQAGLAKVDHLTTQLLMERKFNRWTKK